MEIVFIVLLPLVGVIVCRIIAEKRGASTFFWTVMGAIFGPLAIPFCLLSKLRKDI